MTQGSPDLVGYTLKWHDDGCTFLNGNCSTSPNILDLSPLRCPEIAICWEKRSKSIMFIYFLDIHSFNFPGENPDVEHVFLVMFLSQTLGSLSSKNDVLPLALDDVQHGRDGRWKGQSGGRVWSDLWYWWWSVCLLIWILFTVIFTMANSKSRIPFNRFKIAIRENLPYYTNKSHNRRQMMTFIQNHWRRLFSDNSFC